MNHIFNNIHKHTLYNKSIFFITRESIAARDVTSYAYHNQNSTEDLYATREERLYAHNTNIRSI